jgi:hypothetical protein
LIFNPLNFTVVDDNVELSSCCFLYSYVNFETHVIFTCERNITVCDAWEKIAFRQQ